MKKITLIIVSILMITSLKSVAQDPNFHIYLCFGQSNMEGMGTIEAQDKVTNARVKMLQNQTCSNLNRTYGTWYTAVPPLSRCWNGLGPADYFGKTMADGMPSNITIGLVNTSYGGCDIAFFQKSAPLGKASTQGGTNADIPSQFTGGYAWMLDLAKKAQTAGVIKGIIFHQGETNTGDATWKTKVNEIVTNLRTDLGIGNVPFLAGELLYTNNGSGTTSCCASHNTEVNKIPSVVTNSYVISASGLPGATGDVAHFSSASYRTLGIRYAQKMLTLVKASTNPIPIVTLTAPANNSSACAGTAITINATASVSSGSISKVDLYDGNTLLFSDNSAPYSYTWNGATVGSHTIRAISTSAANETSTPATATITVNAATVIDPYMQVNGGTWAAQTTATLCQGGSINIGPHPYDVAMGWSWTGPNNFSSSVREIGFANMNTTQGGTYTVSFKDGNNCTSSLAIPVTVNAKPTITITSPANNATVSDASLIINANVVGSGISNVQFYNGNTMLGTDNSSPYSYTWNNIVNGSYTLYAKATNANNCTDTATAKITVTQVTGWEDPELTNGITCLPNPFIDNVTLEAKGTFGYDVFGLSGEKILAGNAVDRVTIGYSLPTGNYLLKVRQNTTTKVFKINKY